MQLENTPKRTEEELSRLVEPFESCTLRYHTKPLRNIRFHPDGDILFSSCVNGSLVAWRVANGEKIGNYTGHKGAIVRFDINKEGTKIATGSADMKSNIYDIETGKLLFSLDTVVTPKDVSFSADSRTLAMCTGAIMGQKPKVWVFDVASGKMERQTVTPTEPTTIRTTLDRKIVYGDSEGGVTLMDEHKFDIISSTKMHQSTIKSLTSSFCHTYFVTASTDFKSKIVRADNNSLSAVREFLSDSPNNTARVTPDNRILVSAGGIDARDVTTSGKGNFNIEFFDCATSKLVGYYRTHFGTVNTIDIHPSGTVMATGGEDGALHLVKMDDSSFLNAPFVPVASSEM